LTLIQEGELVKYIDLLTERGLPPTRLIIHNFVEEIAKKDVGKCWVDCFVKRRKLDFVSKWASSIDSRRKRANSAYKYSLYFELLHAKLEKYNIQPEHIYNIDEKGFLIGMLLRQKRIFSRWRYEQGGVNQMIQDGNREWITTIACICGDGSALSPALIY
jgi:hypothetical protein